MAGLDAINVDNPAVAQGLEDLLRAASEYELARERQQYAREYIGDSAWPHLVELVEHLESVDTEAVIYDRDKPEQFDGDVRDALRMLGCLVGLVDREVPSYRIPILLYYLVDNPNLPLPVISDVCHGHGGVAGFVSETPVELLRAVALALLDGHSWSRIKSDLGVGQRSIERVSNMIGAQQALHNRDLERARQAVEDGLSIRQAAQLNGWGRTRAQRLMGEARNG